jgi:DNA-directed RNA polymerase subunit M/transcription elongation factor TFIIS
MKFCSKCGSHMKKTKNGFLCRKCGNLIHANAETQLKNMKKTKHPSLVYVVNNSEDEYAKVSQACPKCGNKEAFHWFSVVSGEHAGIRRERTVEHFKCTKCSHTWTKAS